MATTSNTKSKAQHKRLSTHTLTTAATLVLQVVVVVLISITLHTTLHTQAQPYTQQQTFDTSALEIHYTVDADTTLRLVGATLTGTGTLGEAMVTDEEGTTWRLTDYEATAIEGHYVLLVIQHTEDKDTVVDVYTEAQPSTAQEDTTHTDTQPQGYSA